MGSDVHMDFMLLGAENDPVNTVPVLVAKYRVAKMRMAAVMPTQSPGQTLCGSCDGVLERDWPRNLCNDH